MASAQHGLSGTLASAIKTDRTLSALELHTPIWGLARDTSEEKRDEAVAEKVNQTTKQAMASTADAWLDHLPAWAGGVRSSQQRSSFVQDMPNLDELVSTVQDPQDDSFSRREKNFLFFSLSLCLFASCSQETLLNEYRNSLSLSYRKLARKANEREPQRKPVLVQTRTQRGGVLTFISLIRQMARGTNEGEMDEAASENVNQMTSLSWRPQQTLGLSFYLAWSERVRSSRLSFPTTPTTPTTPVTPTTPTTPTAPTTPTTPTIL
jgi:hypothetical protein